MLARHSQGKICSAAAFLRIQGLQCKSHLPSLTADPHWKASLHMQDKLLLSHRRQGEGAPLPPKRVHDKCSYQQPRQLCCGGYEYIP
jgi:hypothetical protein